MKKVILFLFVAFMARNMSAQNVQTLRIDPESAVGGNVTDFFDSVTYIPLETTKDVLIGDMQHLQVSKNYIYFSSRDSKCIYVFDKSGKFVAKIDRLPHALGGERSISVGFFFGNAVIDLHKDLIYVKYRDENRKNKMVVFSPKGELQSELTLPEFHNDLSDQFVFINDSITAFANKKLGKIGDSFFTTLKNFTTIESLLAPADTNDILIKKDVRNFFKTYGLSNGALWNRSYDYQFYDIVSTTKANKYKFVFPLKYSIDSSFYSLLPTLEASMSHQWYFKDKNAITKLYTLCKEADYMTFGLYIENPNISNNYTFLYSLQTDRLISIDHISPDSSNYFMPISKDAYVRAMSGNKIYTIVPAFMFFEAKNNSMREDWKKSKVLQPFLEKQDWKSNPVIVELSIKPNL